MWGPLPARAAAAPRPSTSGRSASFIQSFPSAQSMPSWTAVPSTAAARCQRRAARHRAAPAPLNAHGVCPSYRSSSRRRAATAASAAADGERGAAAESGGGPSAQVRVDVGGAVEQLSVPLTTSSSTVRKVQLEFPLGLVLEASADGVVVSELTPGGSAAVAGVQVGDVLRATTAATMQMTYPPMNLMFGGVGRPKMVQILFPTTGVPFSKCTEAVRSNGELDGRITLVLEQKGAQLPSGQDLESKQPAAGSSFDPVIFE